MRRANLNQLAVASSETARHINRSIVLNVIRNQQPVSRADVARLCGLQRSTVSLITEELIAEQWVVEGPLGRLPRGRRPTFLHLNGHRGAICVDLRPSHILLGVGDVNGCFTSQQEFPTPAGPEAAIAELVKRIRALIRSRPTVTFEGIGISLPGRVDLATHQLVFAPNLAWPATDLKTPLEHALQLPVELENAANACALSELWFRGAGVPPDLVAITVSEGIGVGIIAHGQLITGRNGMAGEFGHVPLDPDGPLCGCGNRGCWEVLASNRAGVRYYLESLAPAADGRPDKITFQDLLERAGQGEALAQGALNRMARELGRGTRMIVAGLAPQTIAFIGEFTAEWDRFKSIIEAEVQAQSISVQPTIIAGQNGATARLRGTIALVFQRHFGTSVSLS